MSTFTLKDYRNIAGLSQEEIAKELGISRVMYTYKENKKSLISHLEKKQIFEILKDRLKDKLPNLKFEDVFPIE